MSHKHSLAQLQPGIASKGLKISIENEHFKLRNEFFQTSVGFSCFFFHGFERELFFINLWALCVKSKEDAGTVPQIISDKPVKKLLLCFLDGWLAGFKNQALTKGELLVCAGGS